MKNVAKTLPLFESAKRKALRTLCVRRFEEGRWIRAPETFQSDELPDREAVRARFGGGRYEVIGRDGRQIVARTRFVLDGASKPLSDEPLAATNVADPRAFATTNGAREALVFGLLNQGLDLVAITERTGIEARIVRSIFLEWITPMGWPLPTTPEQIADYARLRHAQMMAETERDWTRTWS